MDRPIPPFYCVYLLRSIECHGSLYVGSTPNPSRRLRQHNGEAQGGAVRTCRGGKQPWEMTAIVTGFPSKVAALQFEWAWQNPHLTRHFDSNERANHRSRRGLLSKLSILHLLLRARSFARWPIDVRFFVLDVYDTWKKKVEPARPELRHSVSFVSLPCDDFAAAGAFGEVDEVKKPSEERTARRKLDNSTKISRVDVSYMSARPHFIKSQRTRDQASALKCAICSAMIVRRREQMLVCHSGDCQMVSHLTCLSSLFLTSEPGQQIIPIEGNCPNCRSKLLWSDLVRDLSLRIRASDQTMKVLMEPKAGRKVRSSKSGALETVPSTDDVPSPDGDAAGSVDDDDEHLHPNNALSSSHRANEDEDSEEELPKMLNDSGPEQGGFYGTVANSDFDDIEELLA